MAGYSHEKVVQAAEFLKQKYKETLSVGIICGSGLSTIANDVTEKIVLKYEEIPHFPMATVKSHVGQLVFGKLGGKSVMCMQGRFHSYEGHEAWKIGFPIRVMKLLGIEKVIITNAAGGLNSDFKVGDIMIIKDHISFPALSGVSPLVGPNDDKFGPRFPAMSQAYDKELRAVMRETAENLGLGNQLREGVYCNVCGPSFETIAETKLLIMLGCDVVGMSTSLEVIAAAHCGVKVIALSLVTDICGTDYDAEEDEDLADQVLAVSGQNTGKLKKLVTEFLKKL